MDQLITSIPIEHVPVIHEIEMDPNPPALRREEEWEPDEPLTLLELISAVGDVAETDEEVLATVRYMIESGHVRLVGDIRDLSSAKLCG